MFVEWKTVAALAPEMVLIIAASLIFVGTAFVRSRWTWLGAAIAAYALVAVLLLAGHSPLTQGTLVTGPIQLDEFAQTMRWLGLITGLVTTLAISRQADVRLIGEVVGSIMVAAAGIMIVSSANELITLFLGLELISIPTYVLLFLGRRDAASGEATMKYFFLSILSSSILLYGFSFLYGVGGSTWLSGTEHFPGIREALTMTGPTAADPALVKFIPLAMILIVAGLAFKLTAVPFHFYAPDVYQGTTNANVGLLAVAPKVAAVVALVRIILVAIPASGLGGLAAWQLAVVLSLVTMTIGNVCALWQTNIRRMLAYSSIAHAGYLLIGLAAGAVPTGVAGAEIFNGGVAAVVFYTVVYALASLGIAAALSSVSTAEREVSTLDELAGLAKSRPVIAGVIAICLFSLAGLPPLAGFWGKLQLFIGAVSLATNPEVPAPQLWFTILAITAALNAAIAAAYYLRAIGAMYFQSGAGEHVPEAAPAPRIAAVACAAMVIYTGAFPAQMLQLSQRSERQVAEQVSGVAKEVPQVAATSDR